MTINKPQGYPCGVDLESNCFSHGKLYVAFSRVGNHANFTFLHQKTNGMCGL